MDVIRRRLIVHGEVQGVGFRFSTEGEADLIGVAGYARNLADGTVEIEVEGTPADVERLVAWVREGGPTSARVDRVDISEQAPRGDNGFETRR